MVIVRVARRVRGRPTGAALLFVCALALSLAGGYAALGSEQRDDAARGRSAPLVSVQDLRSWQMEGRDLALVDVRPARACEVWRIPGAVCIAHDDLAARKDELPSDRVIVVYGQSSGDGDQTAADSARLLARGGFARVYELDGGVFAFASDGAAADRCDAGFG